MAAPAGSYVTITSFGAVTDKTTNNKAAIQAAFNYAAANKVAVYIPAGTYAYSGNLTANGITIVGDGTQSVLHALDGANEAIMMSGNGGSISQIELDGTGSTRLNTGNSAMVWIQKATNYQINNVLINGGGAGIISDGSTGGQIYNNTVENTLADSIHTVDGSSFVVINNNRVINSGDDGISTVSYTGEPVTHDVTVQGNTVISNNWGEGISVLGGNNVQITGNYVQGGPAGLANVYIAAESEWSTLGVNNVTVSGNTLVNGGGLPSGTGHGAITIYNSQGGLGETVAGVTLTGNQIVNPLDSGMLFIGNGLATVTATNNNVYSSSGNPLLTNIASQMSVSASGNQMLTSSAYSTPLVSPGGGVTAAPPPTTPSTPANPPPSTTATIALRISEDAYQGDARFIVKVDGAQVGGTITASALHSSGDSSVSVVTGNWATGTHQVAVQFLNDAYDGSATTDRNLYVDSIAYNGTTESGTTSKLPGNGTKTFTVGSGVAAASGPADTVTLHLSEDAWNGNAQFRLLVDGKVVTTPQQVVALHSAGAWQDLSFSGNFGAGNHTIGVQFTNDAHGGSVTTDRNLYVNGIDVNGTHYGSGVTTLMSNSNANFAITTTH